MSNDIRYPTTQLGAVLQEQGRKQRWLASRVGVHESIVSDWIKGKRTVDRARAEEIAEILGVPFYLLFPVANVTELVSERIAA